MQGVTVNSASRPRSPLTVAREDVLSRQSAALPRTNNSLRARIQRATMTARLQLQDRIFHWLGAGIIAAAAIQLSTAATGVITSRVLQPAGKGALTAVLLWPSVIAFLATIGLGDAIAYYTARRQMVLASGMWLAAALSAVAVPIGYFALPLVLTQLSTQEISAARLYLTYIPLNLITLCLTSGLAGSLNICEYHIARASVHIATLVATIVLIAAFGGSVYVCVMGSLVGNVIVLAIAAVYSFNRDLLRGGPDPYMMHGLASFGLRSHMGSLAGMFNLRLDQMLMSLWLPPTALGLYAAAVTVSSCGTVLTSTVAQSVLAHVASTPAEGDKHELVKRYLRLTLWGALFGCVTVWFLAPVLVSVFFGPTFMPAVWPARILAIASVPLGANVVLGSSLKALGRPIAASRGEGFGLLITGVALVVLLPSAGPIGAAAASLAAYAAVCCYLAWQLTHSRSPL